MAAMAGPIQPGRVCASGRVRWMGSIITDGCRNVEWRPSSPRDVHRRATRQPAINLWERMTKQRPSITTTVMVLDPLIYKLGNAIETCTPFVDRVPGELSANLPLQDSGRGARDPGIIRNLKEPVTSSGCRLHCD